MSVATATKPAQSLKLPTHREPYYAGKWQKPATARYADVTAPGSGERLGKVAWTIKQYPRAKQYLISLGRSREELSLIHI